MSIVFNLDDSFKLFLDKEFSKYVNYKKHWVAGLQTKPSYVESYGSSKMIVIQFKTLGASAFLSHPLDSFLNEYITLDHIFGSSADEIWEQLQEAVTTKEKFLITENFLYQKLFIRKERNDKLLKSVNLIINQDQKVRINEICKELNISRKHLNHLFKQKIGLSPKLLVSLYRLQHTFKTIGTESQEKLTSIAYDLDYFDQAHFNNDFKRFTDLTPSQYIKNTIKIPSLKVIPHFLPSND